MGALPFSGALNLEGIGTWKGGGGLLVPTSRKGFSNGDFVNYKLAGHARMCFSWNIFFEYKLDSKDWVV